MFDQLKIFEQLKEIFDEETASRLTRVFASVFEPLESAIQQADRSVERQEAAERARAVDARFDRIDATLERITQIEQRTDERLDALGARVEDLTAAQQRTEQRLEALGARVDDLTAAQARTWEEVTILKDDMRDVRQQLGGLSHTVGYELENKAYVSLPRLLEHDHGIVVDESLVRRFVADRDDNPMELNIVGGAHRGEEKLRIVGEAKAQLSKNAVDNFLRKRLDRLPEDERTVVPVLITHMIAEHDAEDYAREKGVLLYYSYQL